MTLTPDLVGQLQEVDPERFAIESFLGRYSGSTYLTYRDAMREYLEWCRQHQLNVLQVSRVHLQLYLRHLQERTTRAGKPLAVATVSLRFCVVALFYRIMWEDELLLSNPCRTVRAPKPREEDQVRTYLSPLEYAAVLSASRKRVNDHALVALLGMMGLRISEVCSLDVESLAYESGYEVITFIGKGAKLATMPLPIPVMRAVHDVIAGRETGPMLRTSWGGRMTRRAATTILDRLGREAGVTHKIRPHGLRRTFITTGLLNGVPLRDMQIAARHTDPRQTTRYDMSTHSLDRHASHRVASFMAGLVG